MEFYNQQIGRDYHRMQTLYSNEDTCLHGYTLKVSDVLKAHYAIIDYFSIEGTNETAIGGVGPRDKNLLCSAVYRQAAGFLKDQKWKTEFQKCATIFFGIIKDHPFYDCNKRTALLSALYYLSKIGRAPCVAQKEFEKLTLDVARNTIFNRRDSKKFNKKNDGIILYCADFFEQNSREIDKKFYQITFKQLNKILNENGYSLENPSRGYIDICIKSIEKRYIIIGPGKTKYTKIGSSVFPGWQRNVTKDKLKHIREICKITARHGFDSAVLFHGADSLQSLIADYEGPLRRLANK